MGRLFFGSVAIVLCLSQTGCLASKEEAKQYTEKVLATMNSLGDTLASIKDEPSASAAMPKIKEISETLKTLKEEGDFKTAKSATDEIQKEYGPRMDAVFKRIDTELVRVAAVRGGKAVADEVVNALKPFLQK